MRKENKKELGAAVLAVSVAACVTTPPRDIAAARQDLDAREREAADRVMKEEMQRQLDSTRRSMVQPLAR